MRFRTEKERVSSRIEIFPFSGEREREREFCSKSKFPFYEFKEK